MGIGSLVILFQTAKFNCWVLIFNKHCLECITGVLDHLFSLYRQCISMVTHETCALSGLLYRRYAFIEAAMISELINPLYVCQVFSDNVNNGYMVPTVSMGV